MESKEALYVKGQEAKIRVGDKFLILKPLPIGKIKKLLEVVVKAFSDMDKAKSTDGMELVKKIPSIVIDRFEEILPIVVDRTEHPFLTEGWAGENITVPTIEEILEATYIINGVGDFLVRMKKGFGAPPQPAE